MVGNVPDEQAFESIKAGVDELPDGVKMVLNSGEPHIHPTIQHVKTTPHLLGDFYGANMSLGNLELLARFYDKYPDYADKTFLSVKVCFSFRSVTRKLLIRPPREELLLGNCCLMARELFL